VAGAATSAAAVNLAKIVLEFAATLAGANRVDGRIEDDHVVFAGRRFTLAEVAAASAERGVALGAVGHSGGTPRSVAFNVQGFEIAVHKRYGEIRILRSLHAADAGTVINPMQCRGQVEGGVAQAIGAALYENLTFDADGKVANPTFRGYHIPTYADTPETEVHFASTYDEIGPLGAKSMSESPYNPIAAALGNAIRDATGVRLYETPFTADRLYRALVANSGASASTPKCRPSNASTSA
jgi:CO/xanthine dehydrogenase Mo-binding subunit